MGALLAIALAKLLAVRRVENKRRHGFDPTDLRRCSKPTIHSELELLRVYEFP